MITSTWHILALVLAVGSVFLIYYLARLLIQLRDTLKTVENTLTQLQNEVSPVINNVEGITDNFEQMTGRADNIFATVQTKTVSTLGVVDSFKSSLDILKHTLFLFLNHFFKYSRAFNVGFKVGLTDFSGNKSLETPGPNGPAILLKQPGIKIVDHLEHVESKPA